MESKATLEVFSTQQSFSFPPPETGLEPWAGSWDTGSAAHLLRRTTYGPSRTEIQTALEEGLDGTLDRLFTPLPPPFPPLNYGFTGDPNVPIGDTWVDKPYIFDAEVLNYRNISLRAWQIGLLLEEGISIREKLTLFWHNHFGIGGLDDPKYAYVHIRTLRENAWGNFRALVKKVTIDPAMLRFLNGNQNTAQAPNENFARELFELFTIGKGPQIAPGDYTHYTEEDILEASRILTGWVDLGYFSLNDQYPEPVAFFRRFRHDTGAKQLSEKFDNALITNQNESEYAALVDIIFQQKETARFICRKLYRWFLYYDIDETVEKNMIEPMAELLIQENFEMEPVLRTLLRSAHFFDALSIGPMIKNPIDFCINIFKQTLIEFPEDLEASYTLQGLLFSFISNQQMEYFNPPDVAGWKAYYQAPNYYRTWINSSTLINRANFTSVLATVGFNLFGSMLKSGVFEMATQTSKADDPNVLIKEWGDLLFPQPITEEQLVDLKEALIPGLPDYEWTIEYNQYLANPDDQQHAFAVELRLRALLQAMLVMPEYYLS